MPLSPTQYDFDGYLSKNGQVTSCGEIRLPASVMKGVFGRADLRLQTAEGRLLQLRFSERRLSSGSDGAAHVDVVGELPAAADWHRRSGRGLAPAPGAERSSTRPSYPSAARA
jgi:hypothetical protein